MRSSRGNSFYILVALVLTCLTVLHAVPGVAAAAGVTTTPAYPLINVPFYATPDASLVSYGDTLYLTRPPSSATSNLCASTYMVSGAQCTMGAATSMNPNANSCRFVVTAANLGGDNLNFLPVVPTLYWCSSALGASKYLAEANIQTITSTPPYIYSDATSTWLTFNEATPVGTTLGFYGTKTCDSPVSNSFPITVDASRKMMMPQLSSGNIAYLCAKVTYSLSGSDAGTVPAAGASSNLLVFGAIYSSPHYRIFSPTQGLRYTQVDVMTNGGLQQYSLSKDPMCLTLAQTPQEPDATTGNMVLTLTAPMGSYYFCAVTVSTQVGGIFVPADDMFDILAYGVVPTTMYAGLRTKITLTKNATEKGVVFENGLFADEQCTSAVPNFGWTTSLSWPGVASPGTYYACVRRQDSPSTSMAMANPITVLPLPGVNVQNPSVKPAILGLGMTISLNRGTVTGVLTAGVADTITDNGQCTLLVGGNTTSTSSSVPFVVPMDASTSLHTCLATPNYYDDPGEGYIYPIDTVAMRKYDLTYDPIFANAPSAIGLDSKVTFTSGSKVIVVPDTEQGCDVSNPSNSFSVTTPYTLNPVNFGDAGSYLMCVYQADYAAFGYHAVRELDAYDSPAIVSPSGVVAGLPATVTVSGIPANAPVYFITGTDCTASGVTQLFPTTADPDGVATTTVNEATAGTLTVCIGYTKETAGVETTPVMLGKGTLEVGNAQIYPDVAVAGHTNQINVKVPDSQVLKGGLAYLIPGAGGSCSSAVPSNAIQVALTVGSDSAVMPYFDFNPSTAGQTYTVCVGVSGVYVGAGDLKAVDEPTVSLEPEYGVENLPVVATFSGTFLSSVDPDVFVIVPDTASCNDLTGQTIYSTGTMNPTTGVTQPFIAPAKASKIQICIAKKANLVSSTIGYFYGGSMDVYPYTALSRFAQLNAYNNIQSWPLVDNGIVYLTPCATSSCPIDSATATCKTGKQYFTNEALTLTGATPGQYYLCQQSPIVTSAVTGANDTITVLSSSWSLSTTENPIRQYRPFTVTLSGVTIPSGETYQIVVQPASTPCGTTATESQSFPISSSTAPITITNIEPITDIVFCLQPSKYDSFEGMKKTLQFYPTPATLVAGQDNTITSGGVKASGVATKISSTAACTDTISSTTAQLSNYKSTLYLNACGANADYTAGYYCESTNGVTFENRGKMGILRATSCPNGGAAASISNVEVPPGVPITDTGIDTDLLTNPFLSTTADCKGKVNSDVLSKGYSPKYNEKAVFYVCANPITDPTFVFTTTDPTLTVKNWEVTPTSVLSRYSSTVGVVETTDVTINYKTPSVQTFFASSTACSSSLSSASGFNSDAKSATYKTTAVRGLVYICTADTLTGALEPVAEVLSVSTPTVSSSSPAIIIGATFTATMQVKGFNGESALYSMQPGADASYKYASLYSSNSRDVFLSSDKACGSVLTGTSSTTVGSANTVMIATTGMTTGFSQVYLCTNTPAGPGVAEIIPVSDSSVYPTTFVTGTSSPIYMPLNPSTTFQLSYGDNTCSDLAGLPSFSSDANGEATIVFKKSNGENAKIGDYTICYATSGSGDLTPLATVHVIEALHYSISGYTYVVGVPGVMQLLYDLKTDVLINGFSASPDCSEPNTNYGSWSSISTTSIEVTADQAATNLYLCANVPSNNTVASLPGYPAYISFVDDKNIVKPPSGGFNTCNSYKLDSCVAPGNDQPPNGGVLAVIHGDCCNPADRANVLGTASMDASGTCDLSLSAAVVDQYPADTTFTLCAWDTKDTSYCTTLGTTSVTSDCVADSKSGGKSLSTGWLIFIIIAAIIAALLLAALIAYLIWACCCRDKNKEEEEKEKRLVALRQMEGSDFAYGQDSLEEYMGAGGEHVNRNPLLYYAAVGQQEPSVTQSEYSESNLLKAPPSALHAAADEEVYQAAPLTGQESEDYEEEDAEEELAAEEREAPAEPHVAAVETIDREAQTEDEQDELLAEEREEEVRALQATEAQQETAVMADEEEEPRELHEEEEDEDEEEEEEEEEEEPMMPLTASQTAYPTTVAMVQRVEDDTRDQIALEEARERYMMCLRFKEALERQRLKEKEEEVELGYEDDEGEAPPARTPTGHGLSAREAVRPVDDDEETDETEEDGTYDPAYDDGVHQLEFSEEEPPLSSIQRTPEKLRGSEMMSPARHPHVLTNREHVLSQSSAPVNKTQSASQFSASQHKSPSPLRAREAQPPLRASGGGAVATPDCSDNDEDTLTALERSPQQQQQQQQRSPARASPSPPRRADIHEVDPYAANPAFRPLADEEEEPYLPPTTASEAAGSSSGRYPLGRSPPRQSSASPDRGRQHTSTPPQYRTLSPQNSIGLPSSHPHPPMAAFDSPPHEQLYDDDEEYDPLSYTTTQRYHDENRFLCEEEESRRQRLCNWEEEERAQLAQLELGEYMKVARRPPSSDDDDDDDDYEEGTDDLFRAPHRPVTMPFQPQAPRGGGYAGPRNNGI